MERDFSPSKGSKGQRANSSQPNVSSSNPSIFIDKDEKIICHQKLFPIDAKALKTLLHRSIGAVNSLNKFKQLVVGSGVLISKNLVLTSAHNVYDKDEDEQNSYIKFYLEDNGIAEKYYEVTGVRYLQEFKTCPKISKMPSDFALLRLKNSVKYEQFLELSLPCQTCIMNCQKYLEVFGYPLYENNYQYLDKYGQQFHLSQYGLARKNRVTMFDSSEHKIGYGISTLPGQSGCPIVIGDEIIAIHNGGGKVSENYNVARVVDIPLFDKLEQWGKQLKGDPFKLSSKNACPHIETALTEYLREKEEQRQMCILNLEGKGLKEIDLSQKKHLTEVNLRKNKLFAIDVSNNINLTQLWLSSNQLSSIAVSDNINLTQLNLSDNQLSAIDVSNNINLTHLDLSDNQLSAIDVSNNINLTHLDLWNNQLSAIDVSNNINLTHLDLWNNQLSAIDVSNNINLTQLYLSSNRLSAIDVSNNINLTQLNLSSNRLSAIDVSNNINLTKLYLSSNKLSAIDVSNNINLTRLYLSSNKLSAIDVSNNTKLTQLSLSDNALKSVLLSFSPSLQYTNSSHQRSSVCEVRLLYDEKDSQECSQWAKERTAEYAEGGQRNKHGCKYAFACFKRG